MVWLGISPGARIDLHVSQGGTLIVVSIGTRSLLCMSRYMLVRLVMNLSKWMIMPDLTALEEDP